MTTQDPLIPAGSVLSCWTGQYIASFVDNVRFGLSNERSRLQGRSYVVVASRHEYDFDGLTDYIDVLEAFETVEDASAFARKGSTEALAAALSAPTYGAHQWRLDSGWSSLVFPRKEQADVRVVGSERFHVVNGSGYDSIYFEYLVLHITAREVLGNELFAFLGAEYEVMRYFGNKAEVHGSALRIL